LDPEWRETAGHTITGEVPEQQPHNSPSARTTRYWSEDIDSDASRHFRQPRYHRRAELIGERRSVAEVEERSFALGVKQSELLDSFLAAALTVSAI